ncbi:MAG: HupE/UreJ family protein [Cyanobium sp.]
MKRFFLPTTALAAMVVLALGAHPAEAHGSAAGGALAGLAHPLFGVDHLLMLLAVGAAASELSTLLLAWALGGGVIGAVASHGGWTVPVMETLAALAIVAVAAITLVWSGRRHGERSIQLLSGVVVGAGVAIHGLLHGMEAPSDGSRLLWWTGALLSSVVLCGGTTWLLGRLGQSWGKLLALTTLMAGGVLIFVG